MKRRTKMASTVQETLRNRSDEGKHTNNNNIQVNNGYYDGVNQSNIEEVSRRRGRNITEKEQEQDEKTGMEKRLKRTRKILDLLEKLDY